MMGDERSKDEPQNRGQWRRWRAVRHPPELTTQLRAVVALCWDNLPPEERDEEMLFAEMMMLLRGAIDQHLAK